MATIKLDSYTLKNKCIPRINDLKSTLRNARNYLSYGSLPTNFKYRSRLENIINSIDTCITKLEKVKVYINESNSSFDSVLQDIIRDSSNLPTKIINRR